MNSTLIGLLSVILVVTALIVAGSYQRFAPQWELLKRWFFRLGVALLVGFVLLFGWHLISIAIMNHDNYLETGAGFLSVTLPDNSILHFNPITNLVSVESGRSTSSDMFLEDAINHSRLRRLDLYAYIIPYRVRLKESSTMDSWVGLPRDQLVQVWGPPSQESALIDGGNSMIFRKQRGFANQNGDQSNICMAFHTDSRGIVRSWSYQRC